MATIAQSLPRSPGPLTWVREFLEAELAPYPGRAATVGRMTLAATLIMIVGMTFRVPYAWQGAIYALMVSRENTQATLRSLTTIILVTGFGAAYLLVSMWLVISFPLLHFVWIIATLFLAFYAASALTNYTAAVAFINLNALGIPLWDQHVPAETNVEDTLWLCLAVFIAVVITAVVELVFAQVRPGDELILSISDRLSVVAELFTCYAEGRAIDPAIGHEVVRLATIGTSLFRRTLRRSDYSPQFSVEMGGVAAMVGRLVDLAANLTHSSFELSASDQTRFRNLASAIVTIRDDLVNRRIPGSVQFNSDGQPGNHFPLMGEMEHTVTLIPHGFAASRSINQYLPSPDDIPRPMLLAPGALANPEHLRFALKGCLAASGCYVIYSAIAWPGISTAVTTCLLTALSTVGSSRQKQFLRITGAIVGGFLLGMGAQVFILPNLDSIGGLTVLFVALTALSAWIMTSSPRLSYFGIQVALAFYLVNFSEFRMQTSLAVARDRVVGILLGLSMMWLVFDRLWGAPAAGQMKKTFISNLRLLAQFAGEPVSRNLKTAIARSLVLRETITSHLDKVRALADGVLFEFGPSREQDLELRNRIRQVQPDLRMLFITRIALWKYSARLPGFELPGAIHAAQDEFDNRLATALDRMADRMNQNGSTQKEDLTSAYSLLERAVLKVVPKGQHLTQQTQGFLFLSRRIASLANSLEEKI
jgi:multidrug resistance protein MdtO